MNVMAYWRAVPIWYEQDEHEAVRNSGMLLAAVLERYSSSV